MARNQMSPVEKAKLSIEALRLTRLTRTQIEEALLAPPEDQLPLVVATLGTAVDAMEAMTDRMIAELGLDEEAMLALIADEL